MRVCRRCRGRNAPGLRFCDQCGARLGERVLAATGDGGAAQVFGNLALKLDPVAPPRPEPPVSAPVPAPVSSFPGERARELAGDLARLLPQGARDLAGRAAQAARQAAGALRDRVRTAAVATDLPFETQYPAVGPSRSEARTTSPAPAAIPVPTSVVHDPERARQLYLEGRSAYQRGDRRTATRLLAAAARLAPLESPLAEHLARVLRPRSAAATGPTPTPTPTPTPAPTPASAVSPTPGPRRLAPVPGPAPDLSSAPEGDPAPAPRVPLRVLEGGRARPGRSVEVQAQPPVPAAPDLAGPEARAQAREHWVASLPASGPPRPAATLDSADPGRHLEVAASLAAMTGVLGFLLVLFL